MEIQPSIRLFRLSIKIYFKTPSGSLVPLDNFRHLKETPAAKHQSFRPLPSVTVSFNLKPGVSLGQAVV